MGIFYNKKTRVFTIQKITETIIDSFLLMKIALKR